MTSEDVKNLVLDIIEEIAPDENLTNIKPDLPLREQISLDSMDFLDIVMELRKKYAINVPEEDYGALVSLDSCAKYLLPKFKERDQSKK